MLGKKKQLAFMGIRWVTLIAVGILTSADSVSARQGMGRPVRVVSSFSVLGDLVLQVGGDAVSQTVLVGPEQDAHVYEPRPQDNVALNRADVVFFNGLHFEGWMQRLVQASGYRGEVVMMETDMPRVRRILAENGEQVVDPHAWHDVENAIHYVSRICNALIGLDSARAGYYRARAARYVDTLNALHAELKEAFGGLPQGRNLVITTHDAFGYFGDAYGLRFAAPLGWNTEEQATAARVAKLIDQIKGTKALGVFLESGMDSRMARQISSATGLKLGGRLFADALARPGASGSTYVGMMRHNVKTLKAF